MVEEEIITLGNKIDLIGFKIFSGSEMLIIRKMVGNFVKKCMDKSSDFKKLTLHVKTLHEIENNRKYEMKATLEDSKMRHSESSDKNIFICLDSILKKLDKL